MAEDGITEEREYGIVCGLEWGPVIGREGE